MTASSADLFAAVFSTPAVQSLRRRVEDGDLLSLDGVAVGAQPFAAVLLRHLFPGRPVLVITGGVKAQEVFHQDVQTWAERLRQDRQSSGTPNEAPPVLFYPSWETLPHEGKLPHADVISERLESLVALSAFATNHAGAGTGDSAAPIVVTNAIALMQRTFPPGFIAEHTRTIRRAEALDPLDLVEWLEEQGYEPEAQVTQKGHIALRGGILDVWPMTSPWPVRLEFFGNDVESLRTFDPITQSSREETDSVTIPPGGEIGILKKLQGAGSQAHFDTLLEYLPENAIVLLCEPDSLAVHVEQYAAQVPEADPFFASWETLQEQIESRLISIELRADANEIEPAGDEVLSFTSLEWYRPVTTHAPDPQVAEAQRRDFFAQLHRWIRQDYAVHVFCNNDGERQRFEEVWREYGLNSTPGAAPQTHVGALSRGFLHQPGRLVVVTDAEIFGRYKVQRPRRLKSPHAAATRSALDINFAELEDGDYVVHVQYGIGRFLGLQTLPPAQGRKGSATLDEQPRTRPAQGGQECLVIEYAASNPKDPPPKLYVPLTEAHLVSKYVGAGKARPPLNTLSGTRWAKAKAHAEEAVRDLAGQLLSIQAARDSQAGHAFPPDAPWQREFESAFLYEETPDQMRAIVQTKKDLEAPRPMDRLICGDVGFGKTEVAIRAAFKSVISGKQVAVLVPTTVLAQQHFNTFRERMADYPVRVELLSRFRTRREQQRVVRDLACGGVDIVIGTHRLVQPDIQFKDLGLVIIDEEQRFGVVHKERFKMLRKLVDVLTLSATPIPRTLYLALTGARDMSTIETPPQDRLPVETIVTPYDERVIRDAIQRELNRDGQVFYLHNRVSDIESIATRLRSLVPHARIVVGHGRMDADDLEEAMTRFVNGEADVLLSTTIIESGIDIPNANTIIIDRADRFGLSDLYQLRGRVGRYKHQAYAYLLLPRHAGLLVDARKRISAIKQYSTLGSGFKIAMRDLEIRGAGNLLGPQQSGHITAVGFELYCQLLKQSVSALKGEKLPPRMDVQMRLDFLAMSPDEEAALPKRRSSRRKSVPDLDIAIPREVDTYGEAQREELAVPQPVRKSAAYIPLNYIHEPQHRIDAYRKLAQATDRDSLAALKNELRDRFGPLPGSVERLLQTAELKLLAAHKGLTAVETRENKLMLTRNNDYLMAGGKFPRLTKKDAPGRLKEIRKLLQAL